MGQKTKQASKVVEWQGGIFSTLPEINTVSSSDIDDEHYFATGGEIKLKDGVKPAILPQSAALEQIETLIWMSSDGALLGKQSFASNQAALNAIDSFWRATKEPAVGNPHTPTRLVISDFAFAELLRKALGPDIEVVVEHTMELDDLVAAEFDLVPIDIDTSITAIAELLPPDDDN
jgi:hypothetical protein